WRAHVDWGLGARYLTGAPASFVVMRLIAFIPDKALVYLGLGIIPFAAALLPARFWPPITRPWGPQMCGALIMVLQLMAGAAGHILDMFFQRSTFDRKGIVANKAVCQTAAHLYRILYFGSFAHAFDVQLPVWLIGLGLGLAFAGTSLAALVLERMTEANFRIWSRRVVHIVAITFLVRGLWLLLFR
ncbi:MAG: hypothetical protein ACK5JT_06490, partial [Hyphomicrobiaceae bacterium]